MTPKTILLATDLSCRCDRALDRAALLAIEWNARLIVLHALQEPPAVTDLPSWRQPPDPVQEAWQCVRRDLRDAAEQIEFEVVVEQGEPAALILEITERFGVDLIVTGVACDEALGLTLMGTTVDRLVRKANVPVLVVKSRPHGSYRNVVVATDFSDCSRLALETTLQLLPEAQVSLFHAYQVAFGQYPEGQAAMRETEERRAREQCQAILDSITIPPERAIDLLCEYGDPDTLLKDLIGVREVDLIALGTAGRSGLAYMFLGSVAETLLNRLPVDILVVRQK